MLVRAGAIDRSDRGFDCNGVEPIRRIDDDHALKAVAVAVEVAIRTRLRKKLAERVRFTASSRRDDKRQRGGSGRGYQRDYARSRHAIASRGARYSSGPS